MICEMIGGFTPFRGKEEIMNSPQLMHQKMRNGEINLPKNLNNITRDIIKSILVYEANHRFEISDIKLHKFFRGIDWKMVESK